MSNLNLIVAEHEKRAGRVVPSWRLRVALVVMFFGGWFAHGVFPSGWYWALIPVTVACVAFELLLGDYRKRSIR